MRPRTSTAFAPAFDFEPTRGHETAEYVFDLCEGTIDIVAALFNISSKDIRRPGRGEPDIARVRQIAMYVAHVALSLSMRDVGRGFARDRTTVVYACHLVEDLRDDPEFDRLVQTAERIVQVAMVNRRCA
ncbi:MAG: chromosomal replication initiator DnaA [Rhizobiaceae bacterium]|nr:chromosomal replication initiator DnaA [Rhizobiaceae bacterium]